MGGSFAPREQGQGSGVPTPVSPQLNQIAQKTGPEDMGPRASTFEWQKLSSAELTRRGEAKSGSIEEQNVELLGERPEKKLGVIFGEPDLQ